MSKAAFVNLVFVFRVFLLGGSSSPFPASRARGSSSVPTLERSRPSRKGRWPSTGPGSEAA
jgi:hypothetical protein